MKKACLKCHKKKSFRHFRRKNHREKYYIYSTCNRCRNRIKHKQHKERRALAINSACAPFALEDAKKSDKKKGFGKNDLTMRFVKKLLNKGCYYCGLKNIKLSLDRIDNSRGHMKDNVNPCCRRCNFIRGNMPYEAWLSIVPAIKKATKKGLFGRWRGPKVGAKSKT